MRCLSGPFNTDEAPREIRRQPGKRDHHRQSRARQSHTRGAQNQQQFNGPLLTHVECYNC